MMVDILLADRSPIKLETMPMPLIHPELLDARSQFQPDDFFVVLLDCLSHLDWH